MLFQDVLGQDWENNLYLFIGRVKWIRGIEDCYRDGFIVLSGVQERKNEK